MPEHTVPEQEVALFEGAVNDELAPVGPTAIVFGKLGVSADFVTESLLSIASEQRGQTDIVNEFDTFKLRALLLRTH